MGGKIWDFIKEQADTLLALIGAVVVTVLSLTTDLVEQELLSQVTLGVLGVFAFTVVKDRHNRGNDTQLAEDTLARVSALQEAAEFSVVGPQDIGRRLGEARSSTRTWRFKGGTGTYLRSETLPGLALSNHRQDIDVWVEVVAPDEPVCERYARHRSRGNRPVANDQDDWTPAQVRMQSYAVIIAAIWYSEHHRLRVLVALSSTFSTLRYDLSDAFVMITREDSDARAVSIRGDSSYYDSIKRELTVSFEESRELDLRGVFLPWDEITADQVRSVLRELSAKGGLRDDRGFLDDHSVCERIARLAIGKTYAASLGLRMPGEAVNPYPGNLKDRPIAPERAS